MRRTSKEEAECRKQEARRSGRRYIKLFSVILLIGMSVQTAKAAAGGGPGVTETVFNRRFIPTLKPSLSYEQLVKMAGGVQGEKTGERKEDSSIIVQYRWRGGRDSVLSVQLRNNKMTEASVLAPNGRTYRIDSNGQVTELAK